jgi:hypothetical protein
MTQYTVLPTTFFYCYDGVRLCRCGTAAANRPTVHTADDTGEYGAAVV